MSENPQSKISNKIVKCGPFKYSINVEEKTANIVSCHINCDNLIIPRSFTYESNEYIIISILENSFKLSQVKSIQFKNDSEIRSFEKNAFYGSLIESITIPSKVIELKEGWCSDTPKLISIKVSPDNAYYQIYEDKFIIGKTRVEQNHYDKLVFCNRNIENVQIPNFIEHICSASFYGCTKLQQIEIPNDSKLQTIDDYAFSYSQIKSITIPSTLTKIGDSAFYECSALKRVEIPFYSKLQTIGDSAFSYSSIEYFRIPSQVTLICHGAFYGCQQMHVIEIPNDSKLQTTDDYVFCESSIESIFIPPLISEFDTCSLECCDQLLIIEISENSMIENIYKSWFRDFDDVILMIPVNLIDILN